MQIYQICQYHDIGGQMPKRRRARWIELRTASGKLACRYDPRRRLIEYVDGRQKTIFDLVEMDETLANEGKLCYTENRITSTK